MPYSRQAPNAPRSPGEVSRQLEHYIVEDGFSIHNVIEEIRAYAEEEHGILRSELTLDPNTSVNGKSASLTEDSYRLIRTRAESVARDDAVVRSNVTALAQLRQIAVSLHRSRLPSRCPASR